MDPLTITLICIFASTVLDVLFYGLTPWEVRGRYSAPWRLPAFQRVFSIRRVVTGDASNG